MVDWKIRLNEKGNVDIRSFMERQDAVQYESKALNPRIWKFQAEILLNAAYKIFCAYDAAITHSDSHISEMIEKTRLKRPFCPMDTQEDQFDTLLLNSFLLLVGYAIENLIKGIIYSKDPSGLEENDKNLSLRKDLRDHNLANLFVRSDVKKMDRETKDILNWLTQYIVWRGRYAIPLNLQEYKNARKVPSCLKYPDKSNLNLERIRVLIEQLVIELEKMPTPPTHLTGDK